MMKRITAFFAVATLLFAAACQKSEIVDNCANDDTFSMSFSASVEEPSSKASLTTSDEAKSFQAHWDNGDEMAVTISGQTYTAVWTNNCFVVSNIPNELKGKSVEVTANYPKETPSETVRTQTGRSYNSLYDTMSGTATVTLSENGGAVIKMTRSTTILYFNVTGGEATDKLNSATLTIGDGDQVINASYSGQTTDDAVLWFNVAPVVDKPIKLEMHSDKGVATIERKSNATFNVGEIYVIKKAVTWEEETGKTFVLCTEANPIKEGGLYMFALKDGVDGKFYVIKANNGNSGSLTDGIQPSNNKFVDPDDVYVYKAEGTDGAWKFKSLREDDPGYMYYNSANFYSNGPSSNKEVTATEWRVLQLNSKAYRIENGNSSGTLNSNRYISYKNTSTVGCYLMEEMVSNKKVEHFVDQIATACSLKQYCGAVSIFRCLKSGEDVDPDTQTYTVSIADGIAYGTVTASPTSAVAGTEITLTVTPDSRYELDALTVTDANANNVDVNDNKFTMPAADVTVSATFKAIPNIFTSLEELAAADLTSGTEVTVSFENVPIKEIYVTGSGYRNGIYFDIQKGGKDIEIFFQNVPEAWVVGGTVSGTLTNCTWKVYSGTWELAPASGWSWSNLTYKAPSSNVAPTITTQPVSANYRLNATAQNLLVVATSSPAPTYQWYSNTTDSNVNGTMLVGATSTSYKPSTATAGTFYYYCVATNSEGSATSDVAVITVIEPTSASLPFEFDGGKVDITTTGGISQTGLGDDYAASPKLKFDTAGDNVVINFSEAATRVTYTVKGNTSSDPWAGKFDVLESADDVVYTVVRSFTSIENVAKEYTDKLKETSRFVKFVYTTKTTGNVALGKICISNDPEYTITVANDIANGTVTASTTSAFAGAEVLLSATPADGYEFGSWNVLNATTSAAISVNEGKFIMPASNVNVSASFNKIQGGGTEKVYKTALFGAGKNSVGVSSYTGTFSATNNGFTVNLSNFNNNNNGWAYVKTGNKTNAAVGTITTNAAIDKAVTKVVITIDAVTTTSVNSITLYSGTSASSCTTSEGTFSVTQGAQTVKISSPAANKFYKISFDCKKGSSNGLVTVSKVEYYAVY